MWFFPACWGVGFAIAGVSYIDTLPLMTAVMVLRATCQILIPKDLLTWNDPSYYRVYVENLSKTGPLPLAPWIGFGVQSVISGVVSASITFGLFRLIFA